MLLRKRESSRVFGVTKLLDKLLAQQLKAEPLVLC